MSYEVTLTLPDMCEQWRDPSKATVWDAVAEFNRRKRGPYVYLVSDNETGESWLVNTDDHSVTPMAGLPPDDCCDGH